MALYGGEKRLGVEQVLGQLGGFAGAGVAGDYAEIGLADSFLDLLLVLEYWEALFECYYLRVKVVHSLIPIFYICFISISLIKFWQINLFLCFINRFNKVLEYLSGLIVVLKL